MLYLLRIKQLQQILGIGSANLKNEHLLLVVAFILINGSYKPYPKYIKLRSRLYSVSREIHKVKSKVGYHCALYSYGKSVAWEYFIARKIELAIKVAVGRRVTVKMLARMAPTGLGISW